MDSQPVLATGHGEAVEMVSRPGAANSSVQFATKAAASDVKVVTNEELTEAQQQDLAATKSTYDDARGMQRMGKEQQLVRHFRQLSITSFVALATVAWELGLFLLSPGLINGGRAGLVWNTLWSFIAFGPIYLSMAEMASMAPIAGAQYHWVSEFAPAGRIQKIASYITGFVVLCIVFVDLLTSSCTDGHLQ